MSATMTPTTKRLLYAVFLAVLLVLPLSLMTYKLLWLNYSLVQQIPSTAYQIDLSMQVTGSGQDIELYTYLPQTDARQTVSDETSSTGIFTLSLENKSGNRIAHWSASDVSGQAMTRFGFTAQAHHVRYLIPAGLPIPTGYAADVSRYLIPEEGIQSSDPQIAAAAGKLFPEGTPDLLTAATRIHRQLQDSIANRNFSGYTDALTALKLGEASCNGKSRLFAALARSLNIPARLVGGLIMENGDKRTTHQWVELYINGHWVPFDTINDHFAELPANYLTLYTGDLVLFRHSSDINFQYTFHGSKRLQPRVESTESLADTPALNLSNITGYFQQIGISQNHLKIILMIPLGALVVVIFRNIIGLETFGTFLPALIAAASRETGILWGMIGFLIIILATSLVRRLLDWMQLLHSPKMSIILTCVVVLMLLITVISVDLGQLSLAHLSLFPIAILAITAERFATIEEEQGLSKALKLTASTILVTICTYIVMASLFLQGMILAFPELLLMLVLFNIWLGKWVGIRLLEFIRFRHLIFKDS
ncbi:MAG: UUP1 family membrane protein [Gammaproteobacteria bacterium]|nr:UUP1 family membrane protein [Gammaproteobacteria bacterium]